MSTELSDLLEQHPDLADAHVLLLADEENPVLEPLQTVYDELVKAKVHLAQVRSTMESKVQSLAWRAEGWTQVDVETLGPATGDQATTDGPNG